MATRDTTADTGGADLTTRSNGLRTTAQRLATETNWFLKTGEWWIYLAMVAAILIAGNSIAGEVWLYVTLLTIGYMSRRGIAKSAVRDPYWGERGDRNADH